ISKEEHQYECSFDGQLFEDCLSPKSYGNLNTEQTHAFQVRAKGILGNTQNIPEIFKFTSITSSNIIGVLKNLPSTLKIMKVHLSNNTGSVDETDNKGGFILQDVRQGVHTLIFNSSDTPECTIHTTFIPPGDRFKDLGILNYSELAFEASLCEKREGVYLPNQSIGNKSEFNPSEDNPLYKETQNNTTKNISISTNSTKISASEDYFKTHICIDGSKDEIRQVDNVSYYLHPTFTPNILHSNNTDTNFTVSINNWGIFDLKAKVFFKDGSIMDIDLPSEEWKKEIKNIIDNEKKSCDYINS
ncbi:MAG: pYEATS domain-containing protein, partial [Nitrososphaeraceae archaeon]